MLTVTTVSVLIDSVKTEGKNYDHCQCMTVDMEEMISLLQIERAMACNPFILILSNFIFGTVDLKA